MPANRLVSGAAILAFLLLVRLGAGSADTRAAWLYLVALPLGYGHLIGGAWFARRRLGALVPAGVGRGLWCAFLGVSVLNLLAAYSWVLHAPRAAPWVLVPMLLLSAWHIVENDIALGRAYRSGLALGRLRATGRDSALVLGLTAGLGGTALLTPAGTAFGSAWLGLPQQPLAPFSLDELVAAVLLYHAATWVGFFVDRARRLAPRDAAQARSVRRTLLLVHALPLVANALLYFAVPSVHAWVAAPALYLFWSVLHAVQTAGVRAARRPAPRLATA